MALEAEFNTVLLTFGKGGDEVNAAVKAVKIWGGTTLDSVLQLFQEITADRERSGQIVVKKDIDTIECISRTKTERLKLQGRSCKIEVRMDSDTDYTCNCIGKFSFRMVSSFDTLKCIQ